MVLSPSVLDWLTQRRAAPRRPLFLYIRVYTAAPSNTFLYVRSGTKQSQLSSRYLPSKYSIALSLCFPIYQNTTLTTAGANHLLSLKPTPNAILVEFLQRPL